uniref:Uncharacterized protein n=1 Tax=Anguilla anguilla TaxID=7936 RepID=A0A0E9TZ17_ANGAN
MMNFCERLGMKSKTKNEPDFERDSRNSPNMRFHTAQGMLFFITNPQCQHQRQQFWSFPQPSRPQPFPPQ